MSDHARFEAAFGAALAGGDNHWRDDPLVGRALIIHRNTIHKAAQDALAANYPVVLQLVGEAAFMACAAAFVEMHPPVEPRLCLFGDGFDDFIAGYAPFAELAWLDDVARLERCVVEALFAADDRVYDGLSLDLDAPLPLCAATGLVHSAAPVVSIWLAHQPGGDPDTLADLEWTPQNALITRPGHAIIITLIDAVAADFLGDCNADRALGEAAEAAAEQGGDLASLFAVLIGAGAFAAIDDGD